MFGVTESQGGKVRVQRGANPLDPKYTQATVKHLDSVVVWGALGYHGVRNLVLEKNVTVNKERYFELLCDYLEDCFEACQSEVFMHDGAPAHTAKLIKEWFEFCGVDYIKDWPGNSPDLDPIENLWAIIKRRLRGRDTSSVPKLVHHFPEIWDSFQPALLQNLTQSVPNRLKDCIKRKGHHTKYLSPVLESHTRQPSSSPVRPTSKNTELQSHPQAPQTTGNFLHPCWLASEVTTVQESTLHWAPQLSPVPTAPVSRCKGATTSR
ncbi:Transposable element Tcb2 transposase [Chionoecetes opilio]|uniref:Transposable element Tcb2 transposase n=1 Tax=Chionoecetes opilio TaxID=41210 RepID=A0A8J5D2S7_CHIOP|nr:Transposable element Tcb2 transposase [Chionoecetes opilio]